MKVIFVILLLTSLATAGIGRILEVSPYSERGASQVTVIEGYPNPIVTQGSWEMFTLTVVLDGMAYSANFRAKRGFHATDFIVGDPIEVTVDGKNLIVSRPNGKPEKAKVIRRARI